VVREYRINAQGACPSCGMKIPGIWPENPNSVKINAETIPLRVY